MGRRRLRHPLHMFLMNGESSIILCVWVGLDRPEMLNNTTNYSFFINNIPKSSCASRYLPLVREAGTFFWTKSTVSYTHLFIATISTSSFSKAAWKVKLPILPNPLIPIFTDIKSSHSDTFCITINFVLMRHCYFITKKITFQVFLLI